MMVMAKAMRETVTSVFFVKIIPMERREKL